MRETWVVDLDAADRARWLRDMALELMSTYRVPMYKVFEEFAKIPEWRETRMRGGYHAFYPKISYSRLNLWAP